MDNRLYGASSISESPAKRQLNHGRMRWRESLTDGGLKQTCSGSFKNIIHKGFTWKEAREEGGRQDGGKKRTELLSSLKKSYGRGGWPTSWFHVSL